MKRHLVLMAAAVLLVFSVAGCSSKPAPVVAPVVTVVSLQTPVVVPTLVAPTQVPPPPPLPPAATVAVQPAATPTVPAQPTPAASVTPTVVAATPLPCRNNAAFISDVTIRDGTWLPLNTAFAKTWRLQNTGECTWNAGYQFGYLNGAALASVNVYPVPAPVAPGQFVNLTVSMVSPAVAGSYKSHWQLRDPAGVPFGPAVYVMIYAGIPPMPTVVPIPLPWPIPQPWPVPQPQPQPQPAHISLSGDWQSGAYGLHLQEAIGCGSYPCAYQVDYSYWTGGTPDFGSGQGTFNGSTFSATIPGTMPGAPAKTFNCTVANAHTMTCSTNVAGTLTFTH